MRELVEDLLARLDRAVPGRVEGFYVVGSAAMGTFRSGRSDIDFVAILDGALSRRELARLRAVHLGRWTSALIRAGGRWRWPLVCNGMYLRDGDLSRSPLEVTPVAGHVSGRFGTAERDGFDVNPVTWHVLAHHGIAIRGPASAGLQVRTDPAELRAWTLGNLNDYWPRRVQRTRRTGARGAATLLARFSTAGVLGAPRLHYTIATGAIVSKEDAALYSLRTFEPRWHALIEDALAWWRGIPSPVAYRHRPARRRADTVDFVAAVIDAGNAHVRDTDRSIRDDARP